VKRNSHTGSQQCDSLLKMKSEMLYMCPETLSFRDTRHHQMEYHSSRQRYLLRRSIHNVLLGVLKAHSAQRAQLWSNDHGIHTTNTATLTPGNCYIRAGIAAGKYTLRYPGRRHPDAMYFDGQSSVSVRQEV
jgi:hypothetical protein